MIKIIGTSHISKKSIEKVRKTIEKEKPDCVAVELCPKRYYAMLSKKQEISLRYGLTVFLFSWLQKKLGERLGILPGSEMLEAIKTARKVNSKIVLIDMDILRIVNKMKKVSLKEKLKLIFSLFSAFRFKKISIEEPEEKIVEEILKLMKKEFPEFYKVLVKDRNLYMYNWIKKLQKDFKKIIVVVGLGHKKDLEKLLRN